MADNCTSLSELVRESNDRVEFPSTDNTQNLWDLSQDNLSNVFQLIFEMFPFLEEVFGVQDKETLPESLQSLERSERVAFLKSLLTRVPALEVRLQVVNQFLEYASLEKKKDGELLQKLEGLFELADFYDDRELLNELMLIMLLMKCSDGCSDEAVIAQEQVGPILRTSEFICPTCNRTFHFTDAEVPPRNCPACGQPIAQIMKCLCCNE